MNTVTRIALAALLGVTLGAQTQAPVSYTVGIWPATATDPNASAPLNTALYPLGSLVCGEPRLPSGVTVVNPDEGRFDDPVGEGLDCVVLIWAQVRALPSGTYKVAIRANGRTEASVYGAWGETFERRGPPPAPSAARLR